ncbi:MAG TPA: TetR/AcrR family transcriptional regulator [Ktedonobacteraceae bacterium]|nr:TetR/AcrR family transcriptional regulator [Ktedonobacteraceae bacterium]
MSTIQAHLSLKERQRQEREALILQAAEEIFTEKGYYDASIDEIAARVGIAKGTFYAHFSNKEALIVALFAQEMERFQHEIDAIFASSNTARAKLEMALQSLFTGMNRKRSQLLSNVYNGVDLHRILTQNQGQLQDLWKQVTEKITAIIEEGQAAGEFNPALPSKVMLAAFLSLCSPHVLERIVFKEDYSAEDVVKLMGSIFFDGTTLKK